MKKILFASAFALIGTFAMANDSVEKNNEKESDSTVLFEYCATVSHEDEDGDKVSVTCCRPTQADADRCATNKIIEKSKNMSSKFATHIFFTYDKTAIINKLCIK